MHFEGKDVKGNQGNFCSIASVLSDDDKRTFNVDIRTKSDYQAVVTVAQDRIKWKSVVTKVTGAYVTDAFCKLRGGELQSKGSEKSGRSLANRVNFGASWPVCLNVGSCSGVLYLPGCGPLLVWYFVCLKQHIACEVRIALANSN